MICFECMMEKKEHEYFIVHYSVPAKDMDEFSKNPSSYSGDYCICNQCLSSGVKSTYNTVN